MLEVPTRPEKHYPAELWWVVTPASPPLLSWGREVLECSAAAAAKSLQSCPTVRPHRQQPTRFRHPWDSPDKNTGVGCHFLLHLEYSSLLVSDSINTSPSPSPKLRPVKV